MCKGQKGSSSKAEQHPSGNSHQQSSWSFGHSACGTWARTQKSSFVVSGQKASPSASSTPNTESSGSSHFQKSSKKPKVFRSRKEVSISFYHPPKPSIFILSGLVLSLPKDLSCLPAETSVKAG